MAQPAAASPPAAAAAPTAAAAPPPLEAQPTRRKIVKEVAKESFTPKKIARIDFGLMSAADMMKMSHMQVSERQLYQMPKRNPMPNGVLDTRLGVSDKQSLCGTCGCRMADCAGHFGYIKLELPVFHVGYFKAILGVLQNICKTCSRVLVDETERRVILRRLRNPRVEVLARRAIAKKLTEKCKRRTVCPYCEGINGTVKKVGAMKIIHDRFRSAAAKRHESCKEFAGSFEEACRYNKDVRAHVGKAMEDLTPLRALQLFSRIPPEDVELLDMDPVAGRPERLILTHVLVPPVCIRPSVMLDASVGSNEDDITMKLTEIVHINAILKTALDKGAAIQIVMEDWDFLQLQCAMLINGDAPGLPPGGGAQKAVRGFCQRLKGKTGRFRGNLSGKRVDFSGRTVISPDPNLRIDEVGVPIHIAKIMTYPERANQYNMRELRRLIVNGPDVHPGANFIEFPDGGKRMLRYGDRRKVANDLKVGDIVERHIRDGDIVLFNRQPSLHKLSIMCHRARVMPWRTLRFNECVCTPYNADFDGDEMNLHVPQTEEARAEALALMSTVENLSTPRSGEPLIAATQDFLTAAFLMTRKNCFMDRAQFCQACTFLADGMEHIDLPPPALLKPVELWTGKQLFGVLLRPSRRSRILVNVDVKEKSYTAKDEMCPRDGYVCFRDSVLVCGTLGKTTLGSGSKDSLFFVLARDYSPAVAAACMSRLAKATARWLIECGMTIGIEDVTPSPRLTELKRELIHAGYKKCEAVIQEFKAGTLPPQPGCTPEQTVEAILMGELSNIREDAGKVCLRELHWRNAPMIMALCGSKGSNINISQMIASVGQQVVSGRRAPNGFIDRTLPHFPVNSLHPRAKGFVENSFYTGLAATEFFFHTMGGREGLVDTAVKTAETGYMQRRLMKALEDLSTQYDGTVRNAAGTVVQFCYGDDGLDPVAMESKGGRPVNFARTLTNALRRTPALPGEAVLLPYEAAELAEGLLRGAAAAGPQGMPPVSDLFVGEVRDWLKKNIVEEIAKAREWLGLPPLRERPDPAADAAATTTTTAAAAPKAEAGQGRLKRLKRAKAEEEDEEEALAAAAEAAAAAAGEKEEEEERGPAAGVPMEERERIVGRLAGRTARQVECFVRACLRKYARSCIDPGSAVGAVGAQSIGEPGTQMTLKTFHFAGVASMNVTLGVPRIKEIINASSVISTPIIEAPLVQESSVRAARIVKGRIERALLGQVAAHIHEVYRPGVCYLSVRLDAHTIEALQLDLSAEAVRAAILKTPRLKLKEKHVRVVGEDKIRIQPPETQRELMFHSLQHVKNQLPRVIVTGVPSIERAVINDLGGGRYNLLVEGYGLSRVMATPGVRGSHTKSNHVMEVERVLGIEAARLTIMSQIEYTMSSHGMSIDHRHVALLADVMSFRGEVLGITRFGISKMKDSVLMLASFEKTTDHLFEAALHARSDAIVGVSECIIMGVPVPLGTGLFKLLHRAGAAARRPAQRRAPLLEAFNHRLDFSGILPAPSS